MEVWERFNAFMANLLLTNNQLNDGHTKQSGVRKCLNAHYWGIDSDTGNSMLVGSWGKDTAMAPPRDVDVLFQLPNQVYHRFEQRSDNKQSALLQEIKAVLKKTYPATDLGADGQVVKVPFVSYGVEVLPAFRLTDGKYWICDTNGGGRYKTIDPISEERDISNADLETRGNARRLIRMLKRWQHYRNVPMKSFWLEIASTVFLRQWSNATKTSAYHDYMVRDFFAFLLRHGDGSVRLPNMTEWQPIGSAWWTRAHTAHGHAVAACSHEAGSRPYSAGSEWQDIFGPDIPTG